MKYSYLGSWSLKGALINLFSIQFLFDFSCECILAESSEKKEDTLVLKLGSLSMAPQADNPLTRTVLRKDIYQ